MTIASALAVEDLHLVLAVARAGDRRQRLLDARELRARQLHLQGAQRFLELRALARADHRDDGLAFSLDKTTGRNGDILRLTITAVRTNPTIGVDPFIIVSSTGSPGGSDYRSHVTMGLVTN